MVRIILATENKAKYKSVEGLVNFVAKTDSVEVEIKQVAGNIPSPIENGRSALENCQIKTIHYQKFLTDAFISPDDEINAPGLLSNLPGHEFHKFGGKADKTPAEILAYLYSVITNGNKYPITITRYFGCVNRGGQTFFRNSFHGFLMPLQKPEYQKILKGKIIGNPLNYFIYTEGGKKLLDMADEKVEAVYTAATKKELGLFISGLSGN